MRFEPRFSPPVASGMLNANDWQNLFAEANKKLKKDIPAQPGSKFLSLPGEIRNNIYRYCAERSCVSFVHGRQISPGICTFYGLAQACRQTRTEFLPMYVQQTEVKLHDCDLEKYQETFIKRAESAYGASNLIIDTYWNNAATSIIVLLRMREVLPNFKFRFGIYKTYRDLETLFTNLNQNDRWKHYLTKAVLDAQIQYEGSLVHLLVKKEYGEDWMARPSKCWRRKKRNKMKADVLVQSRDTFPDRSGFPIAELRYISVVWHVEEFSAGDLANG